MLHALRRTGIGNLASLKHVTVLEVELLLGHCDDLGAWNTLEVAHHVLGQSLSVHNLNLGRSHRLLLLDRLSTLLDEGLRSHGHDDMAGYDRVGGLDVHWDHWRSDDEVRVSG